MGTFYGYLHSLPLDKEPSARAIEEERRKILRVLSERDEFKELAEAGIAARGLPTFRRWSTYRYISRKPLLGEEEDLVPGPYPYPFYLYTNLITGNVFVGSWRYNITNNIVQAINMFLGRNLIRFSINVHRITQALINDKEKEYFATNLQIDVNSFGSHLETIALSGSDVIGSGFLNIFSSTDFTARQIGLRVSDSRSESARLLNSGGIQFYSDRLRELEVCLGYVNNLGCFTRNL